MIINIVYNAASVEFWYSRLHGLRRGWRTWRELQSTCKLVPQILATLPAHIDGAPPATWSIHRAERTFMGTIVITVGVAGRPAMAVLKLPQTFYSRIGLQEQKAVLAQLHNDPRLNEWSVLLPTILKEGQIAGQAFVAEQALPGRDARLLIADPRAWVHMQAAAATAIGQLHRATASAVVVDAAMLEGWIDRPLSLIQRLLSRLTDSPWHDAAIKRLVGELQSMLAGRHVKVSWIHGDFWPGNVLMGSDAATVTGIIDWDWAAPNELPMLDILNLLLTTRRLVQGCQLGESVRALLDGASWTPQEHAVLDAAGLQFPDSADDNRGMVLLCWLRHIAGHITKSTGQANDRGWVAKNILNVLQSV